MHNTQHQLNITNVPNPQSEWCFHTVIHPTTSWQSYQKLNIISLTTAVFVAELLHWIVWHCIHPLTQDFRDNRDKSWVCPRWQTYYSVMKSYRNYVIQSLTGLNQLSLYCILTLHPHTPGGKAKFPCLPHRDSQFIYGLQVEIDCGNGESGKVLFPCWHILKEEVH